MLKNYLKIAYRSILKHRVYSLLNLFGLTIGIAAAILIGQYVAFEKSYDQFHTKADRIYRLPINFYRLGALEIGDAMNYAPTGPTMKEELPEVEEFVRITPEYSRVVLAYENHFFEEKNVYYADSSFFQVFDYPLLFGDKNSCLTKPRSLVLPISIAEKYFGKQENWIENPIGKNIRFNKDELLTVTGIMEDVPENSHIDFGALMSFTTFLIFNRDPNDNWGWNDFYTYVELKEGVRQKEFEEKVTAFVARHKEFDEAGNFEEFLVQPIGDIHLKSDLSYEAKANGDAKTVNFLAIIALAIILIAWVNYVNLATARAEERAQEVGLRKVIGATKKNLIFQFLSEAGILNVLAVLIAIGLIFFAGPILNAFLGKTIPFSINNLPLGIWGLPIFILLGTLLSGIYPAFVLSSFAPSQNLKGSENMRRRGVWIRKGLVTFQYAISVMLIAGTFIIFKQLKFLQKQDLGFALDQTLIINAPSVINNDSIFQNRYLSFKNELEQYPSIQSITSSSAIPGKNRVDLDSHGGLHLVGDSEENAANFMVMRVDDNFLDAYQMEIIAGEAFSEVKKSDNNAIVINEKALSLLGHSDPQKIIGKKLQYWNQQRTIIGVTKDYHHKSLRNAIEPMILRNHPGGHLYFSVKYSATNQTDVERLIQNARVSWKAVYPDNPFHYFFLDDHYNEQYQADNQLARITAAFSFLIILIACLGLFGLAAYSVSIRAKEIGIRKVLGASTQSIVYLFSRSYLNLLLIAFIIGIPLTYYLSLQWLNNFTSAIQLNIWLFLIPCIAVMLIAIIAVSSQSLRAAFADPVESLRKE